MDTTFAELGLNEQILSGVNALGFTHPTPVQAQAIPYVLAGRDVVASAQTGTGKTAAFTLPVLQLIGSYKDHQIAVVDDKGLTAPVDQLSVEQSAKEPAEEPAQTVQRDLTTPLTRAEKDELIDKAVDEAFDDITNAALGGRRRIDHKLSIVDLNESATSHTSSLIPECVGYRRPSAVPSHNNNRFQGYEKTYAEKHTEELAEQPAEDSDSGEQQDERFNTTTTIPTQPPQAQQQVDPPTTLQFTNQETPAPAVIYDPNDHGPHALVITPTRELATQIDRVAQTVAAKTGQLITTIIGGERYDRQIKRLAKGCDMLVATPGRLIDLMDQHAVDLSHVQVLVLDEADRMLDMGFWPSVRRIISEVPRKRQTLLFSATISGDIEQSMPAMLHDPVNIEIARVGETADTVEERMIPVVQGQKIDLLGYLIDTDRPSRVLVFCQTKQRVDAVAAALEGKGLKTGVMHADRKQRDRERALADFRAGDIEALVATDVMSRGIDVQGIDWVVNFDVPSDPQDYVHRIGRTGRAGADGLAFTFVAPDEISPLREIEYFTKKLLPLWEPEGFTFAQGRIMPNPTRSTSRSARKLFSGSRDRGRGPAGGRFGRHA